MLGADAVDHARGVEGARHVAGPPLPLQQPAQQDGKNLVRIDEVAMLIDRAKAVGVAVGRQPCLAMVLHHCFLQRAICGSIGSGLIPGNSGLTSPRIATKSTPSWPKIPAITPRPEPYIVSIAKL